MLFVGCSKKQSTETDAPAGIAVETESVPASLQQQPSDLLANTSRAVCYSGYRSGQHPDRGDGAVNPTSDQIREDLNLLADDAGFTLIRLYDSGENSKAVLRAIANNGLKIKVMLGIWLQAELSAHETCEWLNEPIPDETLQKNKQNNAEEIQRGIALANEFADVVVAVNVGNENLVDWNDHKVSDDSMMQYVKEVKGAIEQPVTVAENYKWWAQRGKKLAALVDFLAVHVYPVWEGRDIDDGMSYSIENLLEVREALPDARIVVSEAGWATEASEFEDRAGQSQQRRYYNELMAWAEKNNVTTFFFEAFDEDWKGDPGNAQGAEKHWGLYTIDRMPKQAMMESKPVEE
tara:strand:+ start:26616 stop:27662 length:1047 start_codon:yes stop_codon:yes gene_type:complete